MSTDELPLRGRLAGVDYGTVRIGVAVADVEVRIAVPLETYKRRTPALDGEYFAKLAKLEGIVRWVVGLPVHLDGHDSAKSVEARAFGTWLAEVTGVEVVYFDERYTSVEAEAALLSADLSRAKRKARIDKIAAQILLTGYLESNRRGSSPQSLG